MFVNSILNEKNFEIISDKLLNMKKVYEKFDNNNDDFTDLVILGTENLVYNRILTGIPDFNGSSYSIGLNPKGLGTYWDSNTQNGKIENITFLSDLKKMNTTELAVSMAMRIKKKSKKTRFLNVIKALRNYECEEVEAVIDGEKSIVDPTSYLLNKSNRNEAKIVIKDFGIRYGMLNVGKYYHLFNDANNSISKFLVFDQLFDEIIELEEKYTNRMKDRIIANKSVMDELKDDLSEYLTAKSI